MDPGPEREPLTDKQLRGAIEKADVPPRDYRIFGALVFRADWASGVIPDQWLPSAVRSSLRGARSTARSCGKGGSS